MCETSMQTAGIFVAPAAAPARRRTHVMEKGLFLNLNCKIGTFQDLSIPE